MAKMFVGRKHSDRNNRVINAHNHYHGFIYLTLHNLEMIKKPIKKTTCHLVPDVYVKTMLHLNQETD